VSSKATFPFRTCASALHTAAWKGLTDVVTWIIDEGHQLCEENTVVPTLFTPFHIALLAGHASIVGSLTIKRGLRPWFENKFGNLEEEKGYIMLEVRLHHN
jgi:ankyrin repeat protein